MVKKVSKKKSVAAIADVADSGKSKSSKKKGAKSTKTKTISAAASNGKTSRLLDVEGEDTKWPRKKVGVLAALQKIKEECTKKEVIAVLAKMGMNEDKVNIFCYELEEEGYIEQSEYEGDLNRYRKVTPKGMKKKLPSLA